MQPIDLGRGDQLAPEYLARWYDTLAALPGWQAAIAARNAALAAWQPGSLAAEKSFLTDTD